MSLNREPVGSGTDIMIGGEATKVSIHFVKKDLYFGQRFFLKNCGFFNEQTEMGPALTREANGQYPDIDFSALPWGRRRWIYSV